MPLSNGALEQLKDAIKKGAYLLSPIDGSLIFGRITTRYLRGIFGDTPAHEVQINGRPLLNFAAQFARDTHTLDRVIAVLGNEHAATQARQEINIEGHNMCAMDSALKYQDPQGIALVLNCLGSADAQKEFVTTRTIKKGQTVFHRLAQNVHLTEPAADFNPKALFEPMVKLVDAETAKALASAPDERYKKTALGFLLMLYKYETRQVRVGNRMEPRSHETTVDSDTVQAFLETVLDGEIPEADQKNGSDFLHRLVARRDCSRKLLETVYASLGREHAQALAQQPFKLGTASDPHSALWHMVRRPTTPIEALTYFFTHYLGNSVPPCDREQFHELARYFSSIHGINADLLRLLFNAPDISQETQQGETTRKHLAYYLLLNTQANTDAIAYVFGELFKEHVRTLLLEELFNEKNGLFFATKYQGIEAMATVFGFLVDGAQEDAVHMRGELDQNFMHRVAMNLRLDIPMIKLLVATFGAEAVRKLWVEPDINGHTPCHLLADNEQVTQETLDYLYHDVLGLPTADLVTVGQTAQNDTRLVDAIKILLAAYGEGQSWDGKKPIGEKASLWRAVWDCHHAVDFLNILLRLLDQKNRGTAATLAVTAVQVTDWCGGHVDYPYTTPLHEIAQARASAAFRFFVFSILGLEKMRHDDVKLLKMGNGRNSPLMSIFHGDGGLASLEIAVEIYDGPEVWSALSTTGALLGQLNEEIKEKFFSADKAANASNVANYFSCDIYGNPLPDSPRLPPAPPPTPRHASDNM